MNAKYDAEGAILYPAFLGCPEYDNIFEVKDGAIVGEFCEKGFKGECPRGYPRRRNAKRKQNS